MIAAKTDPKTRDLSDKQRYPVRVQKAIKACIDLTKPLREHRHTILEKYSAGYYSGDTDPARPINMIMRGVQILIPYLVADNPKAMITSDKPGLSPYADMLSVMCNKTMKQMFLYRTVRRAVYNSLWSMGITKTGVRADKGNEVQNDGEQIETAKKYCDVVDFEDFVFDPAARTIEECEFLGNGYLVPMDELTDSGNFKNYDRVVAVNKLWGSESPSDISRKINDIKFRELHDYAYVYDVWLPKKKIIATIPKEGEGNKYLRTVDYDGPETGPYDLLGYNFFPDSILAIPPIYTWLDQDEQLNKMARKMFRQSSRDKTVLAYDGTSEEDAKRITQASDGESVGVNSVDRIKELKFGGVNADIWPVIQWLRNNIGEFNNIDILSQGANSKTLGQEQMVMQNASRTADDMIWQIHHFATSIMQKLAREDWSDPMLQQNIMKNVGPVQIPMTINAGDIKGDFFDYWFDVVPYSMQRQSPDVKYQKIMQEVSQVILPTLQIAAQQGAMLNVPELVKRTCQYNDIDVNGLYKMAQPAAMSPGGYQPMAGQNNKSPKPVQGQGDDRIGTSGANQQSNLNQQQARVA